MAILIENMEMPKDCPFCPLSKWSVQNTLQGCQLVWRYVPETETEYWQSNTRPSWCPLEEVNSDKIKAALREYMNNHN